MFRHLHRPSPNHRWFHHRHHLLRFPFLQNRKKKQIYLGWNIKLPSKYQLPHFSWFSCGDNLQSGITLRFRRMGSTDRRGRVPPTTWACHFPPKSLRVNSTHQMACGRWIVVCYSRIVEIVEENHWIIPWPEVDAVVSIVEPDETTSALEEYGPPGRRENQFASICIVTTNKD